MTVPSRARRLIVLNSNYPSETNHYGDVFVHSRLRHYPAEYDVEVFGVSRAPDSWTYEGVRVRTFASPQDVVDEVRRQAPDGLLIHFVEPWMHGSVLDGTLPAIIWVHGGEALGWYRRLWNFNRLRTFVGYPPTNLRQQLALRRMVRRVNAEPSIHFVFPSRWMQKVAEQDALVRFRHASVIPNPVDLDRFPARAKSPELARRVLVLRSFSSRKYATDVVAATIGQLRERPDFSTLHFTICGEGRFHERDTQAIRQLPNVEIRDRFFAQREIPALHAEHGLFLTPTRQDAQGVSMCEAMASGLVPLTSPVTAIPEFVEHDVSGLLGGSADALAGHLGAVATDGERFARLSRGASARAEAQCGHRTVVAQEVDLVERVTSR